MKIELIKETDTFGEVSVWVKITDQNECCSHKLFDSVEDAETWIDEYRYKLQDSKSEVLKTYDL